MPIWRVIYKRITAEKTDKVTKSVEVNTNTKIDEVRTEKIGKGKMLAVDFTLQTLYKPKVGKLEIEGTVYYAAENLSSIMTKTGKKIKLEANVMREIHTAILREPVIISINNAKNLGLPMPISFPSVRVESGSKPKPAKKKATKMSAKKSATKKSKK